MESVTSIYRNLCDIFGIDKDGSNFSFHLKDGVVINKDAHIDNYKCFKYKDSSVHFNKFSLFLLILPTGYVQAESPW